MHEEDLSHRRVSGRQCKQPDRFGVFAVGVFDSKLDEEGVDDETHEEDGFDEETVIVVEKEVDEEEVLVVAYPLPSPRLIPDAPPRPKPRIHIHIIPPSPIAAKRRTPKTKHGTQDPSSKTIAKSQKRTIPLAQPNSKSLSQALSEVTPELHTIPRHATLPSIPCLPNGEFQSWKHFLENGGYVSAKGKVMSPNKQRQVLAFVAPISNPTVDEKWRKGYLERQVKFHYRIKKLREEFGNAPRDLWETCLPDKSNDWYEFAVLLLMICSAMIPDQKLVPFMATLFSEDEVTPRFVLKKHAEDPLFWEKRLQPLGRNLSNSKCIVAAAETTLALGRVPRNYMAIVQKYKGVGPKMALVTVHSAYNDVVSLMVYFNLHLLQLLTNPASARRPNRQPPFVNFPALPLDC
jgi:endonuclease III